VVVIHLMTRLLNTVASPSHRPRPGVTLIEALIAIAILGILVGALAPVVSRRISHSRVNSAAQVLVSDLENAMSLAGRQRRPLRVTVDPAQRSVRIADRASGQTIARRAYGPVSEYKVETLSSSPASIDILPQGMATSAAAVTVGIGGYSRRVTLTRAGLVRLEP
jgi:prepilin-type N-terminal cleavage/methylation domain-containing protein